MRYAVRFGIRHKARVLLADLEMKRETEAEAIAPEGLPSARSDPNSEEERKRPPALTCPLSPNSGSQGGEICSTSRAAGTPSPTPGSTEDTGADGPTACGSVSSIACTPSERSSKKWQQKLQRLGSADLQEAEEKGHLSRTMVHKTRAARAIAALGDKSPNAQGFARGNATETPSSRLASSEAEGPTSPTMAKEVQRLSGEVDELWKRSEARHEELTTYVTSRLDAAAQAVNSLHAKLDRVLALGSMGEARSTCRDGSARSALTAPLPGSAPSPRASSPASASPSLPGSPIA